MKPPPAKTKKRILLSIKVGIVAVVLWWVVTRLRSDWQQLAQYDWDLRFGWLLAAGGLYLLGLLPAALFWRHLLQTMGQRASLAHVIRAYYIGHLGKYVPGKALVVVIRTALIRGPEVNTGVAAATVFLETLTMMASGAFLAAAILVFAFQDQVFLMVVAVGLMLAAGLPTIPPFFRFLVRLAGVGRKDETIAGHIDHIGLGTLARGWVAMTIGWVLLGLSLWATLEAIGVPTASLMAELPRYVASVSLAMVAGFLSLIPGGMGVREMVLTELTEPYFGTLTMALDAAAAAIISAVLLRFVWLISELVISGVLYFGIRGVSPTNPDPDSAS